MTSIWQKIPDRWQSVVKGAAIAAGGAALTYLGSAAVDFGPWAPLVAALASIGLNVIRKWGQPDQGPDLRPFPSPEQKAA